LSGWPPGTAEKVKKGADLSVQSMLKVVKVLTTVKKTLHKVIGIYESAVEFFENIDGLNEIDSIPSIKKVYASLAEELEITVPKGKAYDLLYKSVNNHILANENVSDDLKTFFNKYFALNEAMTALLVPEKDFKGVHVMKHTDNYFKTTQLGNFG
jgi:hypothetical protein